MEVGTMDMISNKLSYLSHPYTTFGDKAKNIVESKELVSRLTDLGIKVLNPIGMFPDGIDNDVAMAKCKYLLLACDCLILSGVWNRSQGCLLEYKWALDLGIPIYYYDGLILLQFAA